MADAIDRRGTPPWRQWSLIAVATAAVIAALSLLWLASEAHYRGCLEKVSVKFPPVAVSAFVTADKANTGPLKVAYATERISAANSCSHV